MYAVYRKLQFKRQFVLIRAQMRFSSLRFITILVFLRIRLISRSNLLPSLRIYRFLFLFTTRDSCRRLAYVYSHVSIVHRVTRT